MNRRVFSILAVLLIAAVAAVAADISGKWAAQVPGRDGGTRAVAFTFKVDGDKLTGSMSDPQGGEIAIADGKVSGDTVSFSVTTERGKRTYTGTISGSEIKFKREGGQNPQEFTAKRATT
jgi:hypothetical protein